VRVARRRSLPAAIGPIPAAHLASGSNSARASCYVKPQGCALAPNGPRPEGRLSFFLLTTFSSRTSSLTKDFQQLNWDAAIEDDLRQLVRLAVREDLNRQHDWTTVALVGPDTQGRAAMVAREPGVVAGLRALPVIIDEMQVAIDLDLQAADGSDITNGTLVAKFSGSARDLLTCERPMLNLVSRLSGIATQTQLYVERVRGTAARIYDTRKTTPGWRRLEKYAVRCGGGHNHRTGLFDAILIKDNHLALAAEKKLSPADAVRRAREFVAQLDAQYIAKDLLIEVEIDRLDQLDKVISATPDIILLDNMSPEELRHAVTRRNEAGPSIELEASGGVSLDTVRHIAEAGVERISVGDLTHSSPALDIGLDWLPGSG
jgi:nicotinate-nucleotide pyrophosphorylase (carboxylating)